MRTYTELSQFETIEERFQYLRLDGNVGDPTFDDMRWVNQAFYRSTEWRNMRRHIIVRDMGMDLGTPDQPIRDKSPLIHHMNPLPTGFPTFASRSTKTIRWKTSTK